MMVNAQKGWQGGLNLSLLALAEFLGGITYSLLTPFYTKEASSKGVSVSQTGIVHGSAFIATVIFSPIFGQLISSIGARNLFLSGTLLGGLSNLAFGFLVWVESPEWYLFLSLLLRVGAAVGEAASISLAAYQLAAESVTVKHQAKAISLMETTFGFGLMFGPFVGGVLYESFGFLPPFLLFGGALALCSPVSWWLMTLPANREDDNRDGKKENATYLKLMKLPVIYCCLLVTCLSGLSNSWFLPSLQPYVEEQFGLGTMTVGVLFMIDGFTYAFLTPLWGWLLDRQMSPMTCLLCGSASVTLGYCLMGPAPFLAFLLPDSIYLTGLGVAVHGLGVAANFITTLLLMLSHSVQEARMPDNERTRGMVTSLWFIFQCLGSYVGSSAGGFAFDRMGFKGGTVIVVALQVISTGIILYLRGTVKLRSTRTIAPMGEISPL